MPTKIAWTNETWNPVTGCTKVSPGCQHCYAESLARRFAKKHVPWTVKAQREAGVSAVTLHPERLEQPFRWRKPRRVFVNSMSDLFHEDVPLEFLPKVFAVMAITPQHTYQLLTKRPEQMQSVIADDVFVDAVHQEVWHCHQRCIDDFPWPLPNVWLGVSVENQRYADERIPLLLETPAVCHFVSCEPLLESVRLTPYLPSGPMCSTCEWHECVDCGCEGCATSGLNWVIGGCESGPRARPADAEWFRSLRDQCEEAAVPYFLKQLKINGKVVQEPELDGRQWVEFPEATQ